MKTGEAILALNSQKYLMINFYEDIAIDCQEVSGKDFPQILTPFDLIAESIGEKDEFSDKDFPPTHDSICKDEMNLAYAEYKWVSYSDAKSKGYYILPKTNDSELVFQDNTSVHIIVFLKILSNDVEFLKSIITLGPVDKNSKGTLPKLLSVAMYKNGFKVDVTLDSSFVVDGAEEPIFGNETDTKCLWPSFVIKAVAKHFGSYAQLEEVTIEDLLKSIYGPGIIDTQLGLDSVTKNKPLDQALRKSARQN